MIDRLLRDQLDLGSTADVRTQLALNTPDAAALAGEFRRLAQRLGEDTARGVVIGTAVVQSTETAPPVLVWTAPGAPAAARRTAQVLTEVIVKAQTSLLVVGYALTAAAQPIIAELARAVERGVDCALVADRMDEKLGTLSRLWPSHLGMPQLWTRPPDSEDEQSALHAKFAVADKNRLLLTSANLTYHGFHGNMEVGVLLEGPVAAEAEQLVREWSRAGLITRVGARTS